MGWRDENNIRCAACLVSVVLAWHIIGVLTANALELFAAVRCEKHFVHSNERVDECLLVVLTPEVLVIFELFYEVVAAEFRHFGTTVAIKDSKE